MELKNTNMKLITILNKHSKALKSEVPPLFPDAKEINIAAMDNGVIMSANRKIKQTKYIINIEIIEEVKV